MDLTHDRTKCEKAGNCPLEHLAPTINEHATSIDEAMERERKVVISMIASITKGNPELFPCLELVIEVAQISFMIGYASALTPLPIRS